MKLLLAAGLVLGASFLNGVHADRTKVTYDNSFPGQGITVDETDTPAPLISGNRLVRVWNDIDPGIVAHAANTNIIYMNRCAGGCLVRRAGTTDSRTDQSHIIGVSQGTLSAFSRGDAVWNNVMTCMRDVFGPFNVVITDQNPGNVPHFEIMVGGRSSQLGFGAGVGGVSPATCASYIPNSLVFVFDVWGTNVEDICATAAQEIAHSFSLDHTTEASDPLTYFNFNGRKRFKDGNENCGSDCVNGFAGNLQCSGPGNQTRACFCGGNQQNPSAEIRALFGDGIPTPPNVEILSPKNGDRVAPGFPVSTNPTDDQGIQRVELYVNNQLVQTLATGPYAFNAPADLGQGTHVVKVSAYDVFGARGDATVQVIIGEPCGKPADCPNDTDTCIGGRCVPGPGVQGGLGSDCSAGQTCASGSCTATTEGAYCTESCMLGAGQCPAGFGCLDIGASDGTGQCFPGFDDGSGGCSAGGGAPIVFGLAFASLVFVRRRRS
jgi:uncharacterized protein (TIGR03382 family)